MSSLKRAEKTYQRLHRERHQPQNRKHLGYLEKKKDYKRRATDFQKKQNALKLLRQKALDKNPEEFHFHMINSQLRNGVHYDIRKDDNPFTNDELKLMQSQDINYVNHKRMIEMNKINKLKSNLHLIDVYGKPKNSHTFFTDTKSQMKNFDFAKRLNTDPSLLGRNYNCPKLSQLKDKIIVNADDKTIERVAYLRDESYKELMKRVEREKLLHILSEKMDAKKKLTNKKEAKPKMVKRGTKTSAPVYKWPKERKR